MKYALAITTGLVLALLAYAPWVSTRLFPAWK
jgi:hypothetical protein